MLTFSVNNPKGVLPTDHIELSADGKTAIMRLYDNGVLVRAESINEKQIKLYCDMLGIFV